MIGIYKLRDGINDCCNCGRTAKLQLLFSPGSKRAPIRSEGFFDFVRAAFTQKRKTLANSFGRPYDKKKIQEAIELLDYPTTVRAEELSPEQFLEFYRVIVQGA